MINKWVRSFFDPNSPPTKKKLHQYTFKDCLYSWKIFSVAKHSEKRKKILSLTWKMRIFRFWPLIFTCLRHGQTPSDHQIKFNLPLKVEVKKLDSLKKIFCSCIETPWFWIKISDLQCETKKATVVIIAKTYAWNYLNGYVLCQGLY